MHVNKQQVRKAGSVISCLRCQQFYSRDLCVTHMEYASCISSKHNKKYELSTIVAGVHHDE
jgi:hypothetical protein